MSAAERESVHHLLECAIRFRAQALADQRTSLFFRSFGSPVMIVQLRNHSSVAGSFHPFPKAGEHERRIVLHADCVWDLSANHLFPLVKGIRQNQTSPFLENLTVRRRRIDSLDPGVDCLVRDLGIFSPVRDQSPLESARDRWLVLGLNRIASTFWLGAML
jgi:hypothetical protein